MFKKLTLVLSGAICASAIFAGCGDSGKSPEEIKKEAEKKKAEFRAEAQKKADEMFGEQTDKKAAVKLDQSSKEGAIRSFFMAIANKDIDTMWALFSPDIKAGGIKKFGDEAKTKEAIAQRMIPQDEKQLEQFKALIDNKEQFDKIVEQRAKQMNMVEIDGKWYINQI